MRAVVHYSATAPKDVEDIESNPNELGSVWPLPCRGSFEVAPDHVPLLLLAKWRRSGLEQDLYGVVILFLEDLVAVWPFFER
jgi:hypothetical protein